MRALISCLLESNMQVCVFKNCKSTSKEKLKFFAFPSDARKAIWLENAGVSYCTSYSRVCEKHFNSSDIKNKLGNYLIKGAVPIRYSDNKIESGKNKNEKSETYLFNSPPSIPPEKKKRTKKIIKKKQNLVFLEHRCI